MNELAQWQDDLAAAIDGRESIGLVLRAATVPGLAAEQACVVYRTSSRGARVAALADVFPVCRRLLGERAFDGLAREFVRREPSDGPDLNRFGGGFDTFVNEVTEQQATFAGLPWLGELVALEWACHQLYYAADAPSLDLERLTDADPGDLYPRPAAALRWLRTSWPVHQIWAAHRRQDEPPAMQVEAGEWFVVIERPRFEARVVSVDADLYRLLDACGRGRSLSMLAADADLDVARLGELIERRWLGAVESRSHVV